MSDDAERRRIIRHDRDAYIRYTKLQEQIRPELIRARRGRRILTALYLVLLALAVAAAVFLAR